MRTVGALQITQILEGLERLGAPRSLLCADAGLDPARLEDPQNRVPWRVVPGLFVAAERRTGDPLVGLHAGAATHARGLPAYLFMSEPTVRAALERVATAIRQAADPLRWELSGGPGHVWLRVVLESEAPGIDHAKEYCVANILGFLHSTFGPDPGATEVRLPHAPQGPEAEYARILGVPVRFRRAHCEIRLDEPLLSRELPTANPVVSRLLVEQVTPQLEDGGLRARVDRVLTQALRASQDDSRARIARLLGVSARTLHRQLAQEGTSFREARDRVRRELALEWLLEPSLATAAVAGRLGFRDARAFARAFRRWTGDTPALHRAKAGAIRESRYGRSAASDAAVRSGTRPRAADPACGDHRSRGRS